MSGKGEIGGASGVGRRVGVGRAGEKGDRREGTAEGSRLKSDRVLPAGHGWGGREDLRKGGAGKTPRRKKKGVMESGEGVRREAAGGEGGKGWGGKAFPFTEKAGKKRGGDRIEENCRRKGKQEQLQEESSGRWGEDSTFTPRGERLTACNRNA